LHQARGANARRNHRAGQHQTADGDPALLLAGEDAAALTDRGKAETG
jgi:hypothetical protein